MSLPPAVMWIDTGGMSGIATLMHGIDFDAHEYPFRLACDIMADWCRLWGPALAVGWERYVPMPGKPQKDAALALEPIGVARYLSATYSCQVLPEAAPGDRFHGINMPRLKALGWWPRGDDAQSAAEHMLAYLIRSNNLPAREAKILAELRSA
jgi:hypothetical protein